MAYGGRADIEATDAGTGNPRYRYLKEEMEKAGRKPPTLKDSKVEECKDCDALRSVSDRRAL